MPKGKIQKHKPLFVMGLKMKTVPRSVQTAQARFTGMKNVDTKSGAVIDYGTPADPITVAIVEAKNAAYLAQLSAYNQLKKEVDVAQNEIKKAEQDLVATGHRILAVAKGKFGFDSNEVEMLGGKRSSERKSPKKKAVVDISADIKKAS